MRSIYNYKRKLKSTRLKIIIVIFIMTVLMLVYLSTVNLEFSPVIIEKKLDITFNE